MTARKLEEIGILICGKRGFIGRYYLVFIVPIEGLEEIQLNGTLFLLLDEVTIKEKTETSIPFLRFPLHLEERPFLIDLEPADTILDEDFQLRETLKGYGDGKRDPVVLHPETGLIVEMSAVQTGLESA